MVWAVPVDSDLETKPNNSLLVVKKSTAGRRPSRDKIQIFTTGSENVLPIVDQPVANIQEITTGSEKYYR